MSGQNSDDLSGFSLTELFRLEVETQAKELTEGLISLESDPTASHLLEGLMRAAHSLKGAARIVGRDAAVHLTHAMEDWFVAAQKIASPIPSGQIDTLLQCVDLLIRLSQVEESEHAKWDSEHEAEFTSLIESLTKPDGAGTPKLSPVPEPVPVPILEFVHDPEPALSYTEEPFTEPLPVIADAQLVTAPQVVQEKKQAESSSRALRVSSENLNRLMGLAGELSVTSRWPENFASQLLHLKRLQQELGKSLNNLRESLQETNLSEHASIQLSEVQQRQAQCQGILGERLAEVEAFDRLFVNATSRLSHAVLECRMRPFSDGVHGFPRMLRDVASELGKKARLEISGGGTLVDRDILERIEAPLGHLLRNALDHGIETPEQRRSVGKTENATVRLEAVHSAGMLLISVADDGGGIDPEVIRQAIVTKRLTSAEIARKMSEAELMEFLFLPGFSMKENVTHISGRGVGLDAVQTMVREVGGTVRIHSQPGKGTSFQLQLPLTLSVIRTLLVEISGEPYAFPLARITGALNVRRDEIETIQGRQHFSFGGQQIGLVTAQQVLNLEAGSSSDTLSVILLGEKISPYGVVIDRFLREQELVVRPLDPRLGKVKDISAAALMSDSSPVLIIDVEDMVNSIENLTSGGRVTQVGHGVDVSTAQKRKRVLVVDDSLTVRELERKLLDGEGYQVEVAVDGMDGWNAARGGNYDLIITDVDMPRIDGIELVKLIKQDARLQSLPVMIVSYKDREEDRQRGLEAGADYYLTKGSFHDESLLEAVIDLIGEAK